jgi:hypothetical protein
MTLRERYRRLSFWNKVGFGGSIASVIGIVLTVVSFISPFSEQTENLVDPYLVRTSGEYLEVLTKLNSVAWTQHVSGKISKAEIADLKNDGNKQIVVGVDDGGADTGYLIAFDSHGKKLWRCDLTAPYNYGRNEICLWTAKGHIFYLDFKGQVVGRGFSDGVNRPAEFKIINLRSRSSP